MNRRNLFSFFIFITSFTHRV